VAQVLAAQVLEEKVLEEQAQAAGVLYSISD
jgi:hypothetical protein